MPALLVDDALVLTMVSRQDVLRNSALLVEDGVITALGAEARTRADAVERSGALLERLPARGQWVLPGFVQTHIHLCQTLLRNGPDDLPLLPWLQGHVWPGEAAHDEETLEISARLGLAELVAGGTTALLDMGTVRHSDAIFRAASMSGLRVTSGNALMDDPSTNPPHLFAGTDAGLAETERLVLKWHGREEGRLRVAYCPRFAVSCTDACLRQVAALARRNGLLVHTHASENRDEIELVRTRSGLANIAYLDHVGLTGPDVVLAHCVHTDEAERDLLAATRTRVAHCPSSNLKLASGIAPVPEYLARGIHVSLGADGAPCNDRLDAFTEMRLAALLPKVRLGPSAISAWEVVRMATAGGAEALGLGHAIGTLEVGKRADFMLLDPDAGFARPTGWRDDPYGPIVYSFDRSQVQSVYVDGRLRHHRTRGAVEGLLPSSAEVQSAVERLKRTQASLSREGAP